MIPFDEHTEQFIPSRILLRWITRTHRLMYFSTAGRWGLSADDMPTLMLATTGRRTGRKRHVPLPYVRLENHLMVAASNAALRENPGWYYNILDGPAVEVRIGRHRSPAHAREVSPEERINLWAELVAAYPRYSIYQKIADREIPLVLLRLERDLPIRDARLGVPMLSSPAP